MKFCFFLCTLLCWIVCGCNNNSTQNSTKDISQYREDSQQVEDLRNLSYTLSLSNPDSGIICGKKALARAQDITWQQGEAYAYNSIGTNYQKKDQYDSAIGYFQQALTINQRLNNKVRMAANLANIAASYNTLGNNDKAINYAGKALAIYRDLRINKNIAYICGNIGIWYINLHDTLRAIKYLDSAVIINRQIPVDTDGLVRNFGSIGKLYADLKNYDSALYYYQNALSIINKPSDEGAYWQIQSEYWLMVGIAPESVLINNKLIIKNRVAEAITNENHALQAARLISEKSLEQRVYECLGLIYEINHDYQNSLKYFKIAGQLSDSIWRNDNAKIGERVTHEASIIQVLREQQKKDDEEKEKEKQGIHKLRGYLIVVALVISIFSIFFVNKKMIKNELTIDRIGNFCSLLVYEIIYLFIDPHIEANFGENPVKMFAVLVILGIVLTPAHERVARYIVDNLVPKEKRLARMKTTQSNNISSDSISDNKEKPEEFHEPKSDTEPSSGGITSGDSVNNT